MTPNIVIMDDADKTPGNEKSDDSNKVDERVFGAFTAFMGDPDFRGKIFWLLLTARPFSLAPDTGRPGRVEEHVPILAPETFEDKKAILETIARAAGIKLVTEAPPAVAAPVSEEALRALFDQLGFITPAAIELIANRARRAARRLAPAGSSPEGPTVTVTLATFADEASAFVPEGSKSKLRLQTIEAVMYCNHLGYLPEPWKTRLRDDPDGLTREREELRHLVGYA